MLETFPYVPLPWRTRVSIAIFSYDGGLNFGVTGDYDAAADIDALCEGIETAMGDLLALAEGAPRPPADGAPDAAGEHARGAAGRTA
jgi:hypothetical protein